MFARLLLVADAGGLVEETNGKRALRNRFGAIFFAVCRNGGRATLGVCVVVTNWALTEWQLHRCIPRHAQSSCGRHIPLIHAHDFQLVCFFHHIYRDSAATTNIRKRAFRLTTLSQKYAHIILGPGMVICAVYGGKRNVSSIITAAVSKPSISPANSWEFLANTFGRQ